VILSYLLSLPFVAIHNPSTCYLVTHCCTSNLSANHSNTKKRCISPSSQLLSSSLLPLRSPSPTRPPPAQPVLPSQFSKHALPALKQLLPPAAAQITPVSARNGLMCRRSFPSFFLSPSSNPDHITNTSGTVASSNDPRSAATISSRTTYCNNASIYTTTTSSAISRAVSSAYSAPVSAATTASGSSGAVKVASSTTSGAVAASASASTTAKSGAGANVVNGGLVGLVGVVAALL